MIVLTTSSAEPEKVKALQSKGIEVIFADSDTEGCVDLEAAMIGLAVKGIDSILLEGGAETAASAFEAGIVDKIRFYMAPILIGGKDAPGAIGGTGAGAYSGSGAAGKYPYRAERCGSCGRRICKEEEKGTRRKTAA